MTGLTCPNCESSRFRKATDMERTIVGRSIQCTVCKKWYRSPERYDTEV